MICRDFAGEKNAQTSKPFSFVKTTLALRPLLGLALRPHPPRPSPGTEHKEAKDASGYPGLGGKTPKTASHALVS